MWLFGDVGFVALVGGASADARRSAATRQLRHARPQCPDLRSLRSRQLSTGRSTSNLRSSCRHDVRFPSNLQPLFAYLKFPCAGRRFSSADWVYW